MMSARCEVAIPEVKELDTEQITVGRHLTLSCKAEAAISDQLQLKNETDPYWVKIFKVNLGAPGEFSLDLTFYRAGEHKLEQIVLRGDDGTELTLAGPPVRVESVLPPPPADGKPLSPYGALLPLQIATPLLYYVVLVLGLALLALFTVLRARKIAYYRRLRNKLKEFDSPVAPDSQFYKSIRAAEKEDYPLAQLEKAFRIYVLRSYEVPLFDLSDARAIRYFKHQFPQYKSERQNLKKILSEFEELRSRPDLTSEVRRNVVTELYRFVEKYKGTGL